MKRTDFYYDLPSELIAHFPPADRGDSRLLHLDGASGALIDGVFHDLARYLRAGDVLVFNDTRVIPARLYGRKASGGRVEILVERLMEGKRALVHIRASKALKAGAVIALLERDRDQPSPYVLEVLGREDNLYRVGLSEGDTLMAVLQAIGHVPLPPYIDRADEAIDSERYQTVYASQPGAVAAPTAGLHFSDEFLAELAAAGVESAFVTLHVGAGTFQPVRAELISEHTMHSEWLQVSPSVCQQIHDARARGGRVIAVGTTSVRCLETAASSGRLLPYEGETDIFIYPGYRFRCVDGLLTNFHLPESTLLMLVSAFAGRDPVLRAYREAIARGYRFFSYGDAMFVLPDTTQPN